MTDDFSSIAQPPGLSGAPLFSGPSNNTLNGFWDNPFAANQFDLGQFADTTTPPEFLGQLPSFTDLDHYNTGVFGTDLSLLPDLQGGRPAGDDVFNAASALYHNANGLAPPTFPNDAFQSFPAIQDNFNPLSDQLGRPDLGRQLSNTSNVSNRYHTPVIGPTPTLLQQNPHLASDNNIGNSAPFEALYQYGMPASRPWPRPQTLAFGSDQHFSHMNFIPPAGETEEGATREMLRSLHAFEPTTATNTQPNTQPTSPELTRQPQKNLPQMTTFQSMGTTQMPLTTRHQDKPDAEEEPEEARPRKRRKSGKVKIEPDIEAHANILSTNVSSKPTSQPRSRKSKDHQPAASPTSPQSARQNRRQSSTTSNTNRPGRPTRENLTEQQKKDNHIRSEKKRRDLITQGFIDLGRLVPELRHGGLSKSNMLTEAAEFLQGLKRGNDALRRKIADIEEGK